MPLDPARYAELFRTESQDQLASINRALLTLETEHEGAVAAAAVAEVFRAVHTVKGMSATMGYQAVAEFSHELESLLDRMRGDGKRVTPGVMDALFASADALEAGIAVASETAERLPAMTTALASLTDAFRDAATPSVMPRPSGAVKAFRITPAGTMAVVDADTPPGGAPLLSGSAEVPAVADPFDGPGVIVRVRQAATTSLPGVRAFMVTKALAALGEVAAVSPALEVLQAAESPTGFAIRVVTNATQDQIEKAVHSVGDIESLHVDMLGRARKRAPTPIAESTVE